MLNSNLVSRSFKKREGDFTVRRPSWQTRRHSFRRLHTGKVGHCAKYTDNGIHSLLSLQFQHSIEASFDNNRSHSNNKMANGELHPLVHRLHRGSPLLTSPGFTVNVICALKKVVFRTLIFMKLQKAQNRYMPVL